MAQNRKDFDYWERYYGKKSKDKLRDSYRSSQSERDHYSSSRKQYKNKSRKGNEPEGRIVGSEYKTTKKKKRSGFSRFLVFIILVVIIFFAGFFTFYAIDNQLFSRNKEKDSAGLSINNQDSEALLSQEVGEADTETDETIDEGASSDKSAATDTNKDSNIDMGKTTDEESLKTDEQQNIQDAQETQNTSTSNENLASNENNNISLWQKVIAFFKNFSSGKTDVESYPEKLKINVYFAMLGKDEIFGKEQRTILAGSPQNAASNAINELLKGPVEDYNFAVIPPGTKLIDVKIVENIAKVNFTQEFLSNSLDTRILDEYIIYTVVNTLTEIPDIRAVTFFIEGKEIKEYGNVDLRLPAIRNEKYLQKS